MEVEPELQEAKFNIHAFSLQGFFKGFIQENNMKKDSLLDKAALNYFFELFLKIF